MFDHPNLIVFAVAIIGLLIVFGGRAGIVNQYDYLNAFRITGVVQGLQDPRLMEQPLTWNERVPDQDAVDDEIIAYEQAVPYIADLIAEDAAAPVYSTGRFAFEATKIPKIKTGIAVNEAMLQLMDKLQRNNATRGESQIFDGMFDRHARRVVYGVNVRKEVLKLAMLMDGYNYDRLGIRLTGLTWGMPSTLKVTPSVAWTSTSATPLTDIQTVRRTARVAYGVNLNRITLSTAALQAMAATTEFQNQAKILGWGLLSGTPAPVIPLQMDGMIVQMIQRLLSGGDPNGGQVVVEVDDRRYWAKDAAGADISAPFLPINVVLLTATANDDNRMAYDFANGNVLEGIAVRAANSSVVGGAIPVQPGPIAYATLADPTLNPPGVVTWGVARGFPRKYQKAASATLTVGNITDSIPIVATLPT